MMPQKQKQTKTILSGSSSSNTRRPPLNKLSKEKNFRDCQVLNRSWLWLMWTSFAGEGLSRGRAERPGLGSLTPESQSWPCWLPNLLFHSGQVPFCLWSWVLVCEMRVGGALPAQKSSVAGVVVMSSLHHLVALQSQVGVPADLLPHTTCTEMWYVTYHIERWKDIVSLFSLSYHLSEKLLRM